MTIYIQGKEKVISLCISGEKCSVMESNGANISTWFGTATVCTEEDDAKGKTIETTERYDKDGNLVEKITREIQEDNREKPYSTSFVKGRVVGIGLAVLSAQKATERAMWASGCCDYAVTSVSNAKPSKLHG